jgi:Ribosome recycling factor.
MRNSIKIMLGEMDAKLTGHAGLLNYRYMNLCIKAEPAALLSLIVTDIEGNVYNIEDVADTMMPDDFKFVFVPKEMEMLPFIQKGIAETHPEFKQEVIKPKEDEHFFVASSADYDKERHIVCTMPEVDNNRYDVMKQSVKALYDERMMEMDKVKAEYTKTLSERTADLPKEEADEAKDKMEALFKQYSDICKQYHDTKELEIEESYKQWQISQAEERMSRRQIKKE